MKPQEKQLTYPIERATFEPLQLNFPFEVPGYGEIQSYTAWQVFCQVYQYQVETFAGTIQALASKDAEIKALTKEVKGSRAWAKEMDEQAEQDYLEKLFL